MSDTPDPTTVREGAKYPDTAWGRIRAYLDNATTVLSRVDLGELLAENVQLKRKLEWSDEQPQDERDARPLVERLPAEDAERVAALVDERDCWRKEVLELRARIREHEAAQDERDATVPDDLWWPFTGGMDTCFSEHDGEYHECCWRAGLAYVLKLHEQQVRATAQDERDGDVRAVAPLATVSGVCTCDRCEVGQRAIYRMIGRCLNCKAEPILMLFRSGDEASNLKCPMCGCNRVYAQRRATDDEVPAAAEDAALDAKAPTHCTCGCELGKPCGCGDDADHEPAEGDAMGGEVR